MTDFLENVFKYSKPSTTVGKSAGEFITGLQEVPKKPYVLKARLKSPLTFVLTSMPCTAATYKLKLSAYPSLPASSPIKPVT